jgi:hypothetical protein
MAIRKSSQFDESKITQLIIILIFFTFGFVVTTVGALNERPALFFVLFALLAWIASYLVFNPQNQVRPMPTLLNGLLIFGPVIGGVVVGTLLLTITSGPTQVVESPPPPAADEESLTVETHFYELQKIYLDTTLTTPWVYPLNENELVAVRSGEVFKLSLEKGEVTPLGTVSLGSIDLSKEFEEYRTLDIYAEPVDAGQSSYSLFISYVHADQGAQCRKVIVDQFLIENTSTVNAGVVLSGNTFFTSECFPIGNGALHQSGGRLAPVPQELRENPEEPEFYLTLGDFQGLAQKPSTLSPPMKKQIGSVLKISAAGWVSLVTGLRNPQGLLLANLGDNKSTMMTSEHGPRGGDEVNVIQEGRDYGWPEYSYGTAYNPGEPEHVVANEGMAGASEPPLYSWVPSIAPSQMIQVAGEEFNEWWTVKSSSSEYGDVLLSTLNAQSIFRMRLEKGAVRYVESIPIGQRIRSFSQLPSGKLVIGSDSGQILIVEKRKSWSSSDSVFVEAE